MAGRGNRERSLHGRRVSRLLVVCDSGGGSTTAEAEPSLTQLGCARPAARGQSAAPPLSSSSRSLILASRAALSTLSLRNENGCVSIFFFFFFVKDDVKVSSSRYVTDITGHPVYPAFYILFLSQFSPPVSKSRFLALVPRPTPSSPLHPPLSCPFSLSNHRSPPCCGRKKTERRLSSPSRAYLATRGSRGPR